MAEYDTIKKISDVKENDNDIFEVTKNIIQTQTISLGELKKEKEMLQDEINNLNERISKIDSQIAEITAVKDISVNK